MRKPAHLTMAGGKTPRQRIWEVVRRKGVFTVRQVRGELPGDIKLDTVRTYLKSLLAGGYLAATDVDGQLEYVLIQDAGLEAPRLREDGMPVTQGLAQEQMWRTLKVLGSALSPRELAAHASTEDAMVTEAAANDYMRYLHKAGYLTRTQAGKGTGHGGIQAKYRLIPSKYSGPRPPMIQRVKAVYDPNLNKVVWYSKAGGAE